MIQSQDLNSANFNGFGVRIFYYHKKNPSINLAYLQLTVLYEGIILIHFFSIILKFSKVVLKLLTKVSLSSVSKHLAYMFGKVFFIVSCVSVSAISMIFSAKSSPEYTPSSSNQKVKPFSFKTSLTFDTKLFGLTTLFSSA